MRWVLTVFAFIFYCSKVCRAYTKLSSKDTQQLINSAATRNELLDPLNPNGYLQPILRVRVPGTENSTYVQRHFTEFFKTLHSDWDVRLDTFTSNTPIAQEVQFTNIIATRDPPNANGNVGRVVIAAHYDSKLEPEGFIGAIDSAAPCALMMHAIATIDAQLTELWGTNNNDVKQHGVQVIFFDGEEAFHEWSETDSTYGARHLAEEMAKPMSVSRFQQRSELDMIDVLVLLDLLGAPNPTIPSYFRETDWLHRKFSAIEDRLERLGTLKNSGPQKIFVRPPMFQYGGLIGDDHVPFLRKGTHVLHLIPIHFPPVWHKITDDADHLDLNMLRDWAQILPVFLAEYLDIGLKGSKAEL